MRRWLFFVVSCMSVAAVGCGGTSGGADASGPTFDAKPQIDAKINFDAPPVPDSPPPPPPDAAPTPDSPPGQPDSPPTPDATPLPDACMDDVGCTHEGVNCAAGAPIMCARSGGGNCLHSTGLPA